jgi:hypothetical protein
MALGTPPSYQQHLELVETGLLALLVSCLIVCRLLFVDVAGIDSTKICKRRKNIRSKDRSTDSWSKYRTVSDVRTNARVASAFGSRI